MVEGMLVNWILIFSLVGFVIVRTRHKTFRDGVKNCVAFVMGIIVAVAVYQYISTFLQYIIPLSRPLLNILSFWAVMALVDFLVKKLIPLTLYYIMSDDRNSQWEKYAFYVLVTIEGVIFITVVLTITLTLPISKEIKRVITSSTIANTLTSQTTKLELAFRDGIGETTGQALDFLTTVPLKAHAKPEDAQKLESMKNPIAVVDTLEPDEDSEKEMLELVNKVRKAHDRKPLELRPELVPVARDYAKQMWQEKFFGHISPSGDDARGRMDRAEVPFDIVGENIAMSSNVTTAHIGLINSQEHLDNILDPEFGHIGIGIIENGSMGEMFVQIFTD